MKEIDVIFNPNGLNAQDPINIKEYRKEDINLNVVDPQAFDQRWTFMENLFG